MMPLSMSGAGEAQIIKKIGGKEEVRSFLEKLGFVVGTEVTVISEIAGNSQCKGRQSSNRQGHGK